MKSSDEYLKVAVECLGKAISALFEEQSSLRRPEPLSEFRLGANEHVKNYGVVRLLSTREAAVMLGVSSDYVEDKVHSGQIRVVELGTDRRQKWRIRADDLMAFINSRTYPQK